MHDPTVTVRLVTELPLGALRALYEAAGWWGPRDTEETVAAILRGSACVAAAFSGEGLIGFGRVLSDSCSDAFVQDVFVLPEWRGQGVGSALVAALCGWCRERGMGWIGLVAQPGTEGLYRRLGFTPLEGHVAMRLPPEPP
jgi:spermidine synthase